MRVFTDAQKLCHDAPISTMRVLRKILVEDPSLNAMFKPLYTL